jgi:hypothetical protein
MSSGNPDVFWGAFFLGFFFSGPEKKKPKKNEPHDVSAHLRRAPK